MSVSINSLLFAIALTPLIVCSCREEIEAGATEETGAAQAKRDTTDCQLLRIAVQSARLREEDFSRLSGCWRSVDEEGSLELTIDYRVVSVKRSREWNELESRDFLLGMPQADFITERHAYLFVYRADGEDLEEVALLRKERLENADYEEEIPLIRCNDR